MEFPGQAGGSGSGSTAQAVTVLVTAAKGMPGQDMARVLDGAGYRVLALGRRDLDVTDAAAVRRELREHRRHHVVNCAERQGTPGQSLCRQPKNLRRHQAQARMHPRAPDPRRTGKGDGDLLCRCPSGGVG
ncbi:sugar nucleotide-binding protein [Streptomyces sp. NPDC001393]